MNITKDTGKMIYLVTLSIENNIQKYKRKDYDFSDNKIGASEAMPLPK